MQYSATDLYDVLLTADAYDTGMLMISEAHAFNEHAVNKFRYISTSAIADRRNRMPDRRVQESITPITLSKTIKKVVEPEQDWLAAPTHLVWEAPDESVTKTRAILFKTVSSWGNVLDNRLPDWREGTPAAPTPYTSRNSKQDLAGVYVYRVESGVYKLGKSDRMLDRLTRINDGQYRPYEVQGLVLFDTSKHATTQAQESSLHSLLQDRRLPPLGSGASTECFGLSEEEKRAFLWRLTEEGYCVLLTGGHAIDDIRRVVY